MKKRISGIISLCVLLTAWYVFRYPLFPWHGMKAFPLYLLVAGVIVIAAAGILRGRGIASAFTAAGYIAGFLGGYFLAAPSYDPGGGAQSSMWMIWLGIYTAAILAGILTEILSTKKQKKQAKQ